MINRLQHLLTSCEIQDFFLMFSQQGNMIGKCGSCAVEELPNYFSDAFKASLKQAKSVMIAVGYSQKLSHNVSDFLTFLMDEINENANILCITTDSISLYSDVVDCIVFMTGINDE
ncbi:hypothetical protein [Sulfurospirillum cavolei]|uniref:hypothetical protein n=1 Tax=Sulfurospirillum cavolei TaxID=366522 RepID=UPI000764C66D|nr:hypothetical protein [Sulfurospirillum cavolei]